jgi:hypothetical protein
MSTDNMFAYCRSGLSLVVATGDCTGCVGNRAVTAIVDLNYDVCLVEA